MAGWRSLGKYEAITHLALFSSLNSIKFGRSLKEHSCFPCQHIPNDLMAFAGSSECSLDTSLQLPGQTHIVCALCALDSRISSLLCLFSSLSLIFNSCYVLAFFLFFFDFLLSVCTYIIYIFQMRQARFEGP